MLALAAALALTGCADAMLSSAPRANGFGDRVIETVRLTLHRSTPALLESRDGLLHIEFPPLSVDVDTEVTLSRYVFARDDGPKIAYQIGPERLQLLRETRLTFAAAALPGGRVDSGLRAARLREPGAELSWLALRLPQHTSTEVLGRSYRSGVFAVVNEQDSDLVGVEPLNFTSEADVLLSRGQISAALAAYSSLIAADSRNLPSRLGRALARLLLLPTHSSVRNLLLRCNLPPIDEAQIYGEQGYLQRMAQDAGGQALIGIALGSASLELQPESVRARIQDAVVSLQVDDRDHIDGAWRLLAQVDLDRAREAFSFGQDLAASGFPGHIELRGSSQTYRLEAGSSGRVHIDDAGRAPGQALGLSFRSLTLLAPDGSVARIEGSASGTLRAAIVPDHPLWTTRASAGPPYASSAAILLSACDDSLSSPFVLAQVQALRNALQDIAADLRVVQALAVEQSLSGRLRPVLPSFLLGTADDIALTVRDVQLLLSLTDLFSAAVDIASAYRWLGFNEQGQAVALRSFLQEQTRNYRDSDGQIAQRQELALSLDNMQSNLQRFFMQPNDPVATLSDKIEPTRQSLSDALSAGVSTLLQPDQGLGILPFDSPVGRDLAAALADLGQAIVDTLPASSPSVSAPNNPGYQVRAHAFFDNPPQHQALLNQVEPAPLFFIQAASPGSDEPRDLNPRLQMSPSTVDALLASVLALPANASAVACDQDSACPGEGYLCNLDQATCQDSGQPCANTSPCGSGDLCQGSCVRRPYEVIPPEVLDRAFLDDGPIFVHAELWRLLRPLFVNLPRF